LSRLRWGGKPSFHPSRGVRSLINVQPGETASAKEQRTQRRFTIDDGERIEEVLKLEEVLMTRRASMKHYWRDAQKPSEIRRRIDRMFRSTQYRNSLIFIILLHTMKDICRYSEQEDYWEAQTVTLRILPCEAEEKRGAEKLRAQPQSMGFPALSQANCDRDLLRLVRGASYERYSSTALRQCPHGKSWRRRRRR
jgi:hypothetical protein